LIDNTIYYYQKGGYHKENNKTIIIDKNELPKIKQTLSCREEIKDIFEFSISELDQDRINEIIKEKPEYLENVGDKNKYLNKKVELRIREKFELKNADEITAGYKIILQDD